MRTEKELDRIEQVRLESEIEASLSQAVGKAYQRYGPDPKHVLYHLVGNLLSQGWEYEPLEHGEPWVFRELPFREWWPADAIEFVRLQHLPSRRQIPAELRRRVLQRDEHACRFCGSTLNLVVDHILPVVRGGPTVIQNLQTLCGECNARKGARSGTTWLDAFHHHLCADCAEGTTCPCFSQPVQ